MEITSPQGRRWGRRLAMGGAVVLGLYALAQIVFVALLVLAFGLGGQIG